MDFRTVTHSFIVAIIIIYIIMKLNVRLPYDDGTHLDPGC